MYVRSIETTTDQAHSIPVGAIAGGIAAGAFLAVIVTLGWLKWRKHGTHRQSEHWDEVVEKKHEAARPALLAPRSPTQKPSFPYPTGRKIKFETRSNNQESESTSAVHGLPGVSKPRPLRYGSSRLPRGTRDRYLVTSKLRLPEIAHKPSTVSSVSMYSTESGEEHQVRVPPNLILAATGGLAVDSRSGQRSVTSSNWSLMSRMAHGNTSRHSQAGTSTYTTISRDSYGAPIGMAL